MNREEWLAARRLGVSGTDVAILMGLNPYKAEDDLLLEKLGVGKRFEGNAATRAGQRLEPFVASLWARENQKILINGSFTVSEENPQFIGTPDFLLGDGSVLEIKTGVETGYRKGLPPLYRCQLAWYLMVTDRPFGTLVACLVEKDRGLIPEKDEELWDYVNSRPHREYRVERDLEFESQMKEQALRFLGRIADLRESRLGQMKQGLDLRQSFS